MREGNVMIEAEKERFKDATLLLLKIGERAKRLEVGKDKEMNSPQSLEKEHTSGDTFLDFSPVKLTSEFGPTEMENNVCPLLSH